MRSIESRKPLQIIVSLATVLSASQALAESSTWIARLTGNLSCQEQVVRSSTLGKAIQDLEAQNVEVTEAKVARLDGRLFCMSCDCPDGTFNVIKVKDSSQVKKLVDQGDWEQVEAKDIRVEGNDRSHRSLPVNPEQ